MWIMLGFVGFVAGAVLFVRWVNRREADFARVNRSDYLDEVGVEAEDDGSLFSSAAEWASDGVDSTSSYDSSAFGGDSGDGGSSSD